ncbi:MAG TPA: YfiR family protein [Bryobacteraceae bacterium]
MSAGRLAADEPPLEYQVKAAFLLNFTKFIGWPPAAFADSRSPLTICVFGDDPFGGALDQMVRGEAVEGRGVAVLRVRRAPEPKSCQVVYVSRTTNDMGPMLAQIGPGVLTVGEGDEFLRQGGMVAFVIENRRVRFDVNQTTAANAGLTLSSRLLMVARVVRNNNQETRP